MRFPILFPVPISLRKYSFYSLWQSRETVLPDERIVDGHHLAAHVLHAVRKAILESRGQEPERDDDHRDEDGKRDIPAAKA